VSGTIDQALSKRGILITCGTGGVGKTTLSAAIAVRAAVLGKKAVVITIDPAKRLATSLGMTDLGDAPTDLTPRIREALARARASGAAVPAEVAGSLSAIIPDTRTTFESFVADVSPNEDVARRLLANPIFQIFAKEYSGANEYMALQRLHTLHRSGEYDCIILDTPPSRNTLAFLQAPRLLAQLFEEKIIRWLVLPANKLVAGGMRKALGVLERLTGTGFMTNLLDFASALFETQEGFLGSLRKITTLLESPEVGFIMVTNPAPDIAVEASHFIETLRQHRFHFDGVALNRTLGYLALGEADLREAQGARKDAFTVIRALQERERSVVSGLAQRGVPLCAKLPELARDVHSVEDLFHVAMSFETAHGA
jgi:anion-transporting  ArsA/GET3 family ATPase